MPGFVREDSRGQQSFFTSGWFPIAKLGEEAIGVVENLTLLVHRHGRRVFVGVAMETDLMAAITNHLALLGKSSEHTVSRCRHDGDLMSCSLETVAWNEPGRFDAVLVEHFEDPLNTQGTSEIACPCQHSNPLRFVPAEYYRHSPRLISLVESSPLYDPSHPAIASISTPNPTNTRFLPMTERSLVDIARFPNRGYRLPLNNFSSRCMRLEWESFLARIRLVLTLNRRSDDVRMHCQLPVRDSPRI